MHHALLVDHDAEDAARLATAWVAAGDRVTLVLLAEAAAAGRPGHRSARALTAAAEAGVALAAHDEALDLRGIATPVGGLARISLDGLADLLTESTDRAVWL